MKFFVTGVAGQLGHDVMNELSARGYTGAGSDLAPVYQGIQDCSAVCSMPYVSMDITDPDAVSRIIAEQAPDVVVHCAAWTAVDAAEDEDKRALVRRINADGTRNIAQACREQDCKMIYLSTDYVFDGQGDAPWHPDYTDYKPLNEYGRSKLGGEIAVRELLEKYYIVRIAWVFGKNGNNFIRTMLKAGRTHDHLRVVRDQIGTPTYTLDLAVLLVDMAETEKYGCYHATNEGSFISWYDFTLEIFRQACALGHQEYSSERLTIEPVTTAEYGLSKAVRPFNSRLDRSKLLQNGFTPLPDWKDALNRYLKEILDGTDNG